MSPGVLPPAGSGTSPNPTNKSIPQSATLRKRPGNSDFGPISLRTVYDAVSWPSPTTRPDVIRRRTRSEGNQLSALPEFNLFGEKSPPPPPPKIGLGPVYDSFSKAGGNLNTFARRALGQQARKLVTVDGFAIEQVAKAAGELGRTRESPSYLGRVVRAMPQPCVNGAARSRLTQAQLERCACASCAEWHKLRTGQPLEL